MTGQWRKTRLGDAALVSTGPFGSVLHKSDYTRHGVPLVNPINIQGERMVPDPSKLISEATKKRLSTYILEVGDVVVARRGEIGRCAVVGPRESGWICGTGSFFVRPLPGLDPHFLANLLRSDEYRTKLEAASTGATMSNLSNKVLGDLSVSIPPLAEQKRVVAILDEVFEGIDTAAANAEKNLANARELLSVTHRKEFQELNTSSTIVTLGSVCSFENGDRGKNYPGKEHRVASGIPFIKWLLQLAQVLSRASVGVA